MSSMLSNFLEEDIKRKQIQANAKIRDELPSGVGGSRVPARPKTEGTDISVPSNLLRDDSIEVTWFPKPKAPPRKTIVPKMIPTPQMLLRKSILFFGGSRSGKTFLINHFMYIMRNSFPMVEVFCPTNAQNQSYNGIIPPGKIREKVLLSDIRNIYDRQKVASSVAKIAKDLPTLHKLFTRIMTPISKEQYIRLRALHEKQFAEIVRNASLSMGQKKAAKEHAKAAQETELRQFYRAEIEANIKKFAVFRDLSEEEQIAIKYRNFNPNILVITDDAMSEIKACIALGKKEHNDTASELFHRGRHADITHWHVFQDDNYLDTGIRAGAFRTIFTSEKIARGYFGKPSNKFSKEEIAEANAIISAVLYEYNFDGTKNFKKLVYSRDDPIKFSYVQAEDHEEFRMCSDLVWKYCSIIDNGGVSFDADNPYLQKFMPKPELKLTMPSHRHYPPN